MKTLLLALLMLLTGCATTGEFSVGIGKTFRYGADGMTGGVISPATVRWNDKWEARLLIFGPQTIYKNEGGLAIKPYAAITIHRLWTFRTDKLVSPELSAGIMGKADERCTYDGDLNCNRLAPLALAACWRLGVSFPRAGVRVIDLHCSNDSLDWGPEAKNLGQDFAMLDVVIHRWERGR